MPIKFRNMTKAARLQVTQVTYDIDAEPPSRWVLAYEPDHQIRPRFIKVAYTEATDGGTVPNTLQVGIPSSLTKYANITIEGSKTIGTVTNVALSSTDLVAAGVPVVFSPSGVAAATNTGQVSVLFGYEVVDDPKPHGPLI